MCSAGAGQDDHLSEVISHILEPIIKMRPGGLEVNSTGDFISIIDDINTRDIPIEEINLEEIVKHLEDQEKEAQKRYDEFDSNMGELGADKSLPEGWKSTVTLEDITFTDGTENIPEGWKQNKPEGWKTGYSVSEDSKGLEAEQTPRSIDELEKILKLRWTKSSYSLVLER